MKGIINVCEVPVNENIKLKHSKLFGWKVVHPWKNDDGSINWFNFWTGGSFGNVLAVLVIVLILLTFFFEYSTNMEVCQEAINQLNSMNNIWFP